MPLTLITALALAVLLEGIVFGAYCSTLEEGDGCCYPGQTPPGSPYSAYGRYRHRRRSSARTGSGGGGGGGGRRTGTVSAPAAATTNQRGGEDSHSSSSSTLVPSMSEVGSSPSPSPSSSSTLHQGRGYSLRQRIMRRASRG
ncbi:hypothetical protein PG996_014345 [Apiospora saccharicola]|uniref:Uncharacterized protein n=1 Tax=Apiospora saccharicola TaxID=335842 RepID=A0ABR1TK17_9PEZI